MSVLIKAHAANMYLQSLIACNASHIAGHEADTDFAMPQHAQSSVLVLVGVWCLNGRSLAVCSTGHAKHVQAHVSMSVLYKTPHYIWVGTKLHITFG